MNKFKVGDKVELVNHEILYGMHDKCFDSNYRYGTIECISNTQPNIAVIWDEEYDGWWYHESHLDFHPIFKTKLGSLL